METTSVRADVAVGELLWSIVSQRPVAEPVIVQVPDEFLDALGFTRRGIEMALSRLEKVGAVSWDRKRPGRPRVDFTTLSVDPRCPWWLESGVAE